MKTTVLLVYFSLLCVIRAHTQIAFADDDFFSIDGTDIPMWNQPVGLMFSPSGLQLFVWEKAGIVYVCNRNASGAYIRQSQPVINISTEVGDYVDYGLTGFALDPDFANNGKIYLSYVVDRRYLLGIAGTPDQAGATIGRITRYTTATNAGVLTADVGSRFVLLGPTKETGIPILYYSHGTGSLVFAADGTLLASMGDGAAYDKADEGPGTEGYPLTFAEDALDDDIIRDDENVGVWRSQMLTSLNGKVLRINPETGDGIVSNPFYEPASPGSTKSKIWAFGLRNPFRISLKPGTGSTNPLTGHIGELFIADVGYGSREELSIAADKGMNFGWPKYEGFSSTIGNIYNGNDPNPELPFPPGTPSVFCGSRSPQNARFVEGLREDNEAKDSKVYYCNDPSGGLLGEGPQYIHARPVLDWRHSASGKPPSVRVGIFTPAGAADTALIGIPASGVTGNLFYGNASTGGIWYTGEDEYYPTEYANTFFFADFGGAWIKRAKFDNGKLISVNDFATNAFAVSMVENPFDGSIFYVDYGQNRGSANTGRVNKINYGGNKPPVAKIEADQYFTAASPLPVNFNGSGSYDPEGGILSYAWDFGDGTPVVNGTNPMHVFTNPTPGTPKQFNVKLTVTDTGSATDEEIFIVSLDNTPPEVTITKPVKNSNYAVGGNFSLDLEATVTDSEDNIVEYEWQVFLEHEDHAHAGPPIYEQTATTTASGIGCDGEDYSWLAKLKVSDNAGLFTIDSSRIFPSCAILPIVLHKFSVTQNGTDNLVKWTTELESDIEYFEVERSSDGIHFTAINNQQARNTAGPNQYSFSDNQFLPGVNYYRLKIVERGAVIRYSVIIRTVTGGESDVLKVVPNPVVGNFSLTYRSREKDRVTIQIRDVAGRLLHTLKEDVNKGQNIIYIQNLPNWNSGIYFISVQNKDEIKQAKFIKAR